MTFKNVKMTEAQAGQAIKSLLQLGIDKVTIESVGKGLYKVTAVEGK